MRKGVKQSVLFVCQSVRLSSENLLIIDRVKMISRTDRSIEIVKKKIDVCVPHI